MYPSAELYQMVGILPLKALYYYQVCLFMKSAITDRNYSTINFQVVEHDHDTRSRNVFDYEISRTEFGKTRISYSGPRLLNEIPSEILNQNYAAFKSKIKLWLLEIDQISKLSKLQLMQKL